MQEEINALKSELVSHRKNNNYKRSMPVGFWSRVEKLAKHLSAKEIADGLGIDLQNLRKRLGRQTSKQKSPQGPFVKLPSNTKPQKTVMKISVTDQVTIEVYS